MVRHFACFHALLHTMQEAYKELMLVLILVTFLMITSSFLIFHVENTMTNGNERKSTFLDVMYWCTKVITTVGDKGKDNGWPKTTLGQLIGAICAILGVFIFSLPIPIVINSFSIFYNNLLCSSQILNKRKKLAEKTWRQNGN